MNRRFFMETICETLLYLSQKPFLDNNFFYSYTKTRIDIGVNYLVKLLSRIVIFVLFIKQVLNCFNNINVLYIIAMIIDVNTKYYDIDVGQQGTTRIKQIVDVSKCILNTLHKLFKCLSCQQQKTHKQAHKYIFPVHQSLL